jgi:hypothetical protein
MCDLGPDHDLLELGRRFKAALPVEMAARRLVEETTEARDNRMIELGWVADEIRDARATTPKGLAVKAEVLAWCAVASSLGPSVDWESARDHMFGLIRAVFEVAGEPLPGFVAETLRWRP